MHSTRCSSYNSCITVEWMFDWSPLLVASMATTALMMAIAAITARPVMRYRGVPSFRVTFLFILFARQDARDEARAINWARSDSLPSNNSWRFSCSANLENLESVDARNCSHSNASITYKPMKGEFLSNGNEGQVIQVTIALGCYSAAITDALDNEALTIAFHLSRKECRRNDRKKKVFRNCIGCSECCCNYGSSDRNPNNEQSERFT